MTDVRMEVLPLSDLLAMRHAKNPKAHNIDSLVASFKRFGFRSPPLVADDGSLLAGHGRAEALERMRAAGQPPPSGIVEQGTTWLVPVVRGASFTSDRERDAYLIADNANVTSGGWDHQLLSEMLEQFRGDGSFEGMGFEKVELDALLGESQFDSPPDFDAAPPLPADDKPRTTIVATVECPSCGHKFTR